MVAVLRRGLVEVLPGLAVVSEEERGVEDFEIIN